MKPLLPVAEAQARLLGAATPVTAVELVTLQDADQRVLARDLAARLTQPPFDASAMDGYALLAEDAPQIGSILTVIGTASAGHAFTGKVGKGQTVRIFTGAPLPDDADAVLIQEDAEVLANNQIRTTFEVTQGRHIRPRGQDFLEGEAVLKAGSELTFTDITLAAAMNHAELCVYRKPVVAILATGDELVPPGGTPNSAQIIASNTFGVSALARKAGADILDLGIVPDDETLIRAAIDKAVAARADILVTLGGASVGDHDLVQAALKAQGMVLDFWRIAMRPGKPLIVGAIGEMQVLGLPGNPVASLVCSLLFLEPLIRKLGHRQIVSRHITAETATTLKANDQRQDYLRARIISHENGQPIVEAFSKQDSAMMKIMAQSDCLIVRAPFAEELKAGGECVVVRLRT